MDETERATLQQRLSRRRLLMLTTSAAFGSALLACTGDDDDSDAPNPTGADDAGESPAATGKERPQGWSAATHSNDAAPDYDTVFPGDRINRMAFTVSPESWRAMLDNMTELVGPRGARPGTSAGRPTNGRSLSTEKPMWVPANVSFNGLEWTHVGLRFKGNSSLRNAWSEATDRMPFKLDFDEFEDDHPGIHNQRFYGFKQLSLSNQWMDPTGMRDAIAYDLLEEAGLPAAETGFYEVTLDYGEGPKDLGLYTVIEVIDDTVVDRYFEDGGGNIYDAEGPTAAGLAAGTDGQIEASFKVQSDRDKADWSDIRALYDALHSPLREDNPAAWRAGLESLFNVEGFLKWLALAALLEHWDAYGAAGRNYYLYNDPQSGQIHWISWDHNLILGAVAGPGSRTPAGARGSTARFSVPFDKTSVGDEWPLISLLFTQPEYVYRYHAALSEFIEGPFEPARLMARIEAYERLLAPVLGRSNDNYAEAVDSLIAAVERRAAEARQYLANQ